MRCWANAFAAVTLSSWWVGVTLAQPSPAASGPSNEVKPPSADLVAVTVGGHQIMESEIDEAFQRFLQARMGGRTIPPDQLPQMRERLAPQIREALINDWLLDGEVRSAKVEVTGDELLQEMEKGLRGHLVRTGMTRAEFEEQLQAEEGVSLQEFLTQRATNPDFRQAILHARFLEKKYKDELTISDQEIKVRYEESLPKVYSKPALVKASHILIGAESVPPEEKPALRQKAEAVLAEAKRPGADFAALAGQHSTCPSRSRGGDLGFFPREGAMVEPFAAAAFALKPGAISDIVETRFGYHVIKVTARKDPVVITLEQATEAIREELKAQKIAEVRERHLTELRKTTPIVYSESEKPGPKP